MIVFVAGKDLTGILAQSNCSRCGQAFETGDVTFVLLATSSMGAAPVKVCAQCAEPRPGYLLGGVGVFVDARYAQDPDPQCPHRLVWRPDTPPEVIARFDESTRYCAHLAVQMAQAAGRPQQLRVPNTVLN